MGCIGAGRMSGNQPHPHNDRGIEPAGRFAVSRRHNWPKDYRDYR